MNLTVVIVVITLVLIFSLWINSMKTREYAISVAKNTCQKWDVQLLDETVYLIKIKIIRSASVRTLCFYRKYAFEYTVDGISRYKGFMQFNGNTLIDVYSDSDIHVVFDKQASDYNNTDNMNNVVDLNEHRSKYTKK